MSMTSANPDPTTPKSSATRPLVAPRDIRAIARDLGYSPDWNWSWENYKNTIVALTNEYDLRDHLEIGGGRDPVFQPPELVRHGIRVTINDISQKELDLAPPEFSKLCCDIASPSTLDTIGRNRFDFAYCSMVMEHVPDVAQMWRNIYGLLIPGGAALSFFPTLFAPPFVANQLMPEALSRAVLHTLFPDRRDDGGNPKFPAHYNYLPGQRGGDRAAPEGDRLSRDRRAAVLRLQLLPQAARPAPDRRRIHPPRPEPRLADLHELRFRHRA